MSEPLNILFLCTRNAARSLLAEACLNALGKGRFRAWSAGSWPVPGGKPDAFTLQVLNSAGIATEGLRSKSWDEYGGADAPRFNLVITLCDAVADEPCPVWSVHPDTVHWSYPDPSKLDGTDDEKLAAYRALLLSIHRRLELLASLPASKLEHVVVAEFARELAHAAHTEEARG